MHFHIAELLLFILWVFILGYFCYFFTYINKK